MFKKKIANPIVKIGRILEAIKIHLQLKIETEYFDSYFIYFLI